MTATLTDRYIAAAVRSLPLETQKDVEAELRASIADDVEARVEQGEAPAAAERAVITALGDPDKLAAGYTDRPLHLIGPRYYLTWWRLLKLLLWIVPACAMVGVVIANAIADAPLPTIIGTAISVGIATLVHVAFWTTLVFFLLERTGTDTGVRWTPDALPEPQQSGTGRGDLIASLVFLGVAAAALLWDRFVGLVLVGGDGAEVGVGLGTGATTLSFLNPELWPWWLGGLLVVLALEAALAVAVYAVRGWTAGLGLLNTVLALAVAVPALFLLLTGRLFNPAFIEFVFGRHDLPPEVGRILTILAAVLIVMTAGWDVIDGWRKTFKNRR
jgi:hypothetical protein